MLMVVVGFKTLNQAQLLSDTIWYPDSLEPRQWLVYYISRPLLGIFEEIKITPAIMPMRQPNGKPALPIRPDPQGESGESATPLPKKKDIKSFNDLLNSFPMIARQMQPGLERLFKEFNVVFDKPLPPPPSATVIPDPMPDGPIAKAMKKARSNSTNSAPSFRSNGHVERRPMEDFFAEDDEDVMRGALETAVTAAIDLFQMVDKQQLSLLGATTDLTGPVVERLIERYVTEQVHDTILYPRLCAMKRPEDMELESKIRQMEFVDISQVGIPIQGGQRGKHELTLRLGRAVEEFRKLGVAGSPQQMMDILLLTLKTVTQLTDPPKDSLNGGQSSEKANTVLTINADTLVSLLLIVVIRSQVRYLQARLLYMRHFIFIDDVESGEMGYALSTFEAVLSYLARDSGGLRKASRRNHKLWEASKKGKVKDMMSIMEPDREQSSDEDDGDDAIAEDIIDENTPWSALNGHSRRSSKSSIGRLSQASTLNHVYPFQIQQEEEEERLPPLRRPKTVTMDTRSMSSSSEMSFRSRATTIDSMTSGIEGDTSIERLSQTQDSFGESVPMMAIQNERPESLKYLLSLHEYYPPYVVLDDANNEGTTLLSAAVQLGHTELIDIILDFIYHAGPESVVRDYLAKQDTRGRSVAHYLFNAPALISRVGRLLPWRQKDRNGQTPLFALCRSYDHGNYRQMVEAALVAATNAQGDGQPLHLDDHIDVKGNTLLHIVNDPQIALRVLLHCDSDVNATNDKKFTSLMVASKYGRLEMVRALFGDPRVDLYAKELRGLTAVELAKDDDVRNRIDDLILFSGEPAADGRITAVVRAFFVEDATIRLVVKSGAPSQHQSYTVTTCRRSLADFEHLAKLLALENPASWLPSISGIRSPFQFPSKPSRAVLRDTQVRLNGFLKILLAHSTFSTHEMLWEFFLVPDIQADMMEQRSKLKAETRVEKVREEYEPVDDLRDVEQFVDHARDMVRSVNYSTKSVARRANMVRVVTTGMFH
jgi:ankyrin repeat protein